MLKLLFCSVSDAFNPVKKNIHSHLASDIAPKKGKSHYSIAKISADTFTPTLFNPSSESVNIDPKDGDVTSSLRTQGPL